MATPTTLTPKPGFCVKTALEHAPPQRPRKVFVNIAYDPAVPPPPPHSEDAIARAMQGVDADADAGPDAYYVPVVVSDPRPDTDKAGRPALVFDAVFNSSIRSRILRDPAFKLFIIELALQRIEAQASVLLARQIGTPNIASKGKLAPRTVLIPATLAAPIRPRPLVEPLPAPKSILKDAPTEPVPPAWSWKRAGDRVILTFQIPRVTRAHIPHATLDLEPRRLILLVPPFYALDLDLDLPDSALAASAPDADAALTLKRVRDLDVDSADAEWRVAEGVLVLTA